MSRTGAAAFVLRDANFNVVGLLDDSGSVLQQFDHDPYGGVIGYDQLGAWAHNRIGFQGLFADRFDVDAPQPELRPGADITYNARNRDCRPDLGRWVQAEPLGLSVHVSVLQAFHGLPVEPMITSGPQSTYADGMSRYGPWGSDPTSGVDPCGLFFSLPGMMIASNLATDIREEYDDQIMDQGQTMADTLGSDLAAAAFNQLLDYSWASDWDEPDDLYTGSAQRAMGTGSWAPAAEAAVGSGGPALGGVDGAPDWFNAPQPTTRGPGVYLVVDESGDIIYAGRTADLKKRRSGHLRRFGSSVDVIGIPVRGSMSRRGLEDMLIRGLRDEGHPLRNKIFGIAETSPRKGQYYRAAKDFLRRFR